MSQTCDRCGTPLGTTAYQVRVAHGRARLCFRCILRHRPFILRAGFIALFVGTFLTAVNQGNVILGGDLPAALFWKVPLTYAVPFCVSSVSSILASRTTLPDD